jgi:hypothetical protein
MNCTSTTPADHALTMNNTWGMVFTCSNKQTGAKNEGSVVEARAGHFLKIRLEAREDAFATKEYHLLAVPEGCALRVLVETYDAGGPESMGSPDMLERQWLNNLERLKHFCEAA